MALSRDGPPNRSATSIDSNCTLEYVYSFPITIDGGRSKMKHDEIYVGTCRLRLLGVELLTESNTQLLAETLKGLKVLLVLLLGLDLGLDTYL